AGRRMVGAEAVKVDVMPSFVGLKNRFCQPRPKAWEQGQQRQSALKERFGVDETMAKRPFRAGDRLSATDPSLRLGLTETALQAGRLRIIMATVTTSPDLQLRVRHPLDAVRSHIRKYV